ncbi:MAG: diacylglycerol kinase family protein [bacterium]|nr:diacylglycerol kinase family protein [bacterium]
MNMISRDERKKQKGIKKFLISFTYPIKGLRYAYNNEQNLAFDVGMALVVCILGFLFHINKYEWSILVLTIGLVISCELINTAIEAVVDLITEEYHPLAKVAKDTSAAAVFIFAIVAVIVGLIIFLPKLISLI